MRNINIKKINFNKLKGIVPAIIQDCDTQQVLMLGFMNQPALEKTIKQQQVVFWSRTKQRLWQKGEVSGHCLSVLSINVDCDNDSLLIRVRPQGPTCHTGQTSCFFSNQKSYDEWRYLQDLYELILSRKIQLPKQSYTAKLFKSGIDAITQKIGEEATEVVIAGKNKSRARLIEEVSDLLFHTMVLLAQKNIALNDIGKELKNRQPKLQRLQK